MKEYDVEVTLKVIITVEANNQSAAKQLAIETAEAGCFENGVESISARIRKE